MFKIGAFSKLVHVSNRMLRHYEKCGLVYPVKIDKISGNRYYSAAQIPLLNRITSLRDMGFTIAEIGDILDNYNDKDYVEMMIVQKSKETQELMSDLQMKLAKIESMNLLVSTDSYAEPVEITAKPVPSYPVLSLRKTLPDYSYQNNLWEELFAYIDENNLYQDLTYQLLCIYHCQEYVEKNVDIEVCAIVKHPIETNGSFTFRETNALPLAATAVFKGFYSEMALWEGTVAKWIDENKYEVIGPEQFYCIDHFLNCEDTNNFQTEIQFPIKKSKGEQL